MVLALLVSRKELGRHYRESDEGGPSHDQSCSKEGGAGIQVREVAQRPAEDGRLELEDAGRSRARMMPKEDVGPGTSFFGMKVSDGPTSTEEAKHQRRQWYRENNLHLKRVSNGHGGDGDDEGAEYADYELSPIKAIIGPPDLLAGKSTLNSHPGVCLAYEA